MSLGGDFSSSVTDKLIDQQCCSKIQEVSTSIIVPHCSNTSGYKPVATYPSLLLQKKCTPPTPAQFALYPKVAIPCSLRTQCLVNRSNCASLPHYTNRFAQYNRYQVPEPCAPLTQLAASAGISKPSTRGCNIYPNT
jgi:hypothetical protein